ncbi:MAG: RNA polymerase subunit sigma-24, partial [Ilumatobacter sp.]|nr:RNA polymerase subunit sigma-24 [Ilumatobacter sp.]
MNEGETPGAAHAAAGGGLSFADMYDAHVEEVYRFVFRRCRDHALAEDITQETFMAAIRKADDPSTLSVGWLMTVARNRLVDV